MASHNDAILITGANGLLGQHMIAHFSKITKVYALARSKPLDLFPNVEYIPTDFGGNWSEHDLPSNIKTVFHLVQSNYFRDFPDQAMDIFKVNVESTARLLDWSRRVGVKQFVYASSGGVYGGGAYAFHENSPIIEHNRLGYYLGSKLCSEILVETYSKYMTVNILRVFFMYGRNQKRTMLIPRLVDNVRAGNPITLQGSNGLKINPIHVSDVVSSLESIISLNESTTFNIAGAEILSLREIGSEIGKQVKKEPIFNIKEELPEDLVADITIMKKTLHTPRIIFSQGIKDLI